MTVVGNTSSGRENSTCPITLTSCFGCRTLVEILKPVMQFP